METGSSEETGDPARDQGRASVELGKGCDQRRVALFGGAKEPVVGSTLLRLLPDTLDRVVRGRVGRLDAMAIGREPRFAVGVEVVARAIIDDEEVFRRDR